ncbi:MAG TPA: hypothetical protein VMH04_11995 [Candidatus Solibacter sp.]|nr:hypothetical protein [Candidatus Solibacter sp.]
MLAEDAARGPLARELGAHLGASLEKLPPVVRVRTLSVQLKIPASKLNALHLTNAWGRAFTVALHRALAHPPGGSVISCRRYESSPAYLAAMLCHIAANGVTYTWEFPELSELKGSKPWEAALRTLIREPELTVEILQQLQLSGSLEVVLNILDDSALESLMQVVSGREEQSLVLTTESFVELGKAAASEAIRKWPFSSRGQAVRLWARLQCRMPLLSVWHGLRLLVKFLEMPSLLTLHDPALFADSVPFPPWCLAVAEQAVVATRNAADRSKREARISADLISVLEMLRPLVPTAATSPASGRGASVSWISSDCAGILLMLSIAQRLDLWRFSRSPALGAFGGPRVVSFLLAGVGMALVKRFDLDGPVDPAVAVFAGMFGQPDLAAMRHFFLTADVHAISDFVKAESWPAALDSAAEEMTRCFARLVRGFRNSSRDAVARQFLRICGRVLVEPRRVLVVLEPSPWAVALRISGMDGRLQRVEWMDDRSVEFVLEGL